jgi:hypothetical protein
MLGLPRIEPPFGARKGASPRMVISALGLMALGVLAVRARPRTLFRSGRSTDTAPDGQAPDVLLDVTELEVERITLEVENLRAHVSVLAELASLVNLSVGVDARLDRVKLEIEGVEAKVLLKVRLEHIRAILEKALETVAEHPELLRIVSRSLSRLVRESLEEAQATLSEVLEGLEIGDTVDEVLKRRLEEISAIHEDLLERQEAGNGGKGAERRALGAGSTKDRTPSVSEEE